jgi:hypothetical protein
MNDIKKPAPLMQAVRANKDFLHANNNKSTDFKQIIQVGIVQHCKDTTVICHSLEWAKLIDRLSKPEIREAKDGKAIIFSIFSKAYRKSEHVTGITAIGLDIEINKADGTHPIPAKQAADLLRAKGIESVIYTTHSHTHDAPRYRIILPIDRPTAPDKLIFAVVADVLPELAHWVDKACVDVARLFYLPAVPASRAANFEFHYIEGEITKAETLECLVKVKKAALEAARASKGKWCGNGSHSTSLGSDSVISRFNQSFRLDEILQAHGYIQKGKRWLSPESSTGVAGVFVFSDGRMFSHHGDMLSQGGLIDPFEVFCQLEYGGNKSQAARAALKLLERV